MDANIDVEVTGLLRVASMGFSLNTSSKCRVNISLEEDPDPAGYC